MLILAYWTVPFFLSVGMIYVAWLDIREIRAKLAKDAKKRVWAGARG